MWFQYVMCSLEGSWLGGLVSIFCSLEAGTLEWEFWKPLLILCLPPAWSRRPGRVRRPWWVRSQHPPRGSYDGWRQLPCGSYDGWRSVAALWADQKGMPAIGRSALYKLANMHQICTQSCPLHPSKTTEAIFSLVPVPLLARHQHMSLLPGWIEETAAGVGHCHYQMDAKDCTPCLSILTPFHTWKGWLQCPLCSSSSSSSYPSPIAALFLFYILVNSFLYDSCITLSTSHHMVDLLFRCFSLNISETQLVNVQTVICAV